MSLSNALSPLPAIVQIRFAVACAGRVGGLVRSQGRAVIPWAERIVAGEATTLAESVVMLERTYGLSSHHSGMFASLSSLWDRRYHAASCIEGLAKLLDAFLTKIAGTITEVRPHTPLRLTPDALNAMSGLSAFSWEYATIIDKACGAARDRVTERQWQMDRLRELVEAGSGR
jgi:hypothetical protein